MSKKPNVCFTFLISLLPSCLEIPFWTCFNGSFCVDLKKNYIDSEQIMIVDEGISHLPFLFQNTETHLVLELLTSELSDIEVIFLPNPGSSTIKERLKSRGHKRLKYLNVDSFMSRNRDIECYLIDQYPHLSKNLIIFGDD